MKYNTAKKWLLCLVFIMSLGILMACEKDEIENESYMSLDTYFNITPITGHTPCSIIIDNNIIGQGIIENDEDIYIPYEVVRTYINNKFYVDKNEKLLIYSTPTESIDSEVGTDVYGNGVRFDKIISIEVEDVVYISLEYCIKMCNNIEYTTAKEPNRLVIHTILNNTIANIKDDGKVRFEADVMSEILFDVKAGDTVFVLSEMDKEYTKVSSESGVTGYIKTELIGDTSEKMYTLNYEPLEYEHNIRDYKICLAWHQVGGVVGEGEFSDAVSETVGLNVISPTWYDLNKADGSFTSISSAKYVRAAHEYGLEVWGLISDFSYDEENGTYYVNEVLSSTSTRRKLIDNLIDEAIAVGLDGINIDFECVSSSNGEDYVQFIRELSIECREKDIVLSVDMYVPIASNLYYDRTSVGEAADYVIVMGYDEHWGGSETAGSTASIGFVEQGIVNTISEVEPSRVINAIPFYTRVWIETPEALADEDDVIIEDSVFGNYTLDSFAVGMGTAKRYLNENGVTPVWLEECGQYYGEYKINDITYRIWLEEHESLKLKLDVMGEYNLGGVACWKLGLEINDVWPIIDEYVNQ